MTRRPTSAFQTFRSAPRAALETLSGQHADPHAQRTALVTLKLRTHRASQAACRLADALTTSIRTWILTSATIPSQSVRQVLRRMSSV